MGYNKSWILRNESEHAPYQAVTRALEMRNASAGQIVWQGGNGSEAGTTESEEHGEEQTYRHFTTTVQIVIFIGSLLGKWELLEFFVDVVCLSLWSGTADQTVTSIIFCLTGPSSCILGPQVYDFMFLVDF